MNPDQFDQDNTVENISIDEEKSKHKPSRFYHQDLAFGIMVTVLVWLKVLLADFWITEIGLRFHYVSVLLGSSILLLVLGFIIVLYWRMDEFYAICAVVLGIFAIFVVLVTNGAGSKD